MTALPRCVAGVELGGTHARVAVAAAEQLLGRVDLPVTSPTETLSAIGRQLARWNEQHRIAALGIASFGPVRVDPVASDHGKMLATPKTGWTGADVLGPLAAMIDGPSVIHTDVTAAAVAEGAYGAARGCSDHAYVTVGTGVGIGLVAGDHPITGALHTEGGHLRVRRRHDDKFPGHCPFHGDCLEGLISGPALRERTGTDPASLPREHAVWTDVANELAEAAASLFLMLSCQKVVIGGGVFTSRPDLLDAVARRTSHLLGGYLPHIGPNAPVCAAELPDAGLFGALHLARKALENEGV